MRAYRAKDQAKAEDYLKRCGYKAGGAVGDKASDKKLIKRAFTQHDDQLHGGKKTRLKLANGGTVSGPAAPARLDRRARGGSTNINIITPGAQPQPKPPLMGAGLPPMGLMPKPPLAAPGGPPQGLPAGMPPGGAPPMGMAPRPPGMKRGGAVNLKAGAGGGEGRLEKARQYGTTRIKVKSHTRRRSGGAI